MTVKTIVRRLWTEPALVVAVLVGGVNAALCLPDWKAAGASVVVSLSGGAIVRRAVTPVRPA